MIGLAGGFFMPLLCCVIGYIIGWLYRAEQKATCKNHEDCKFACYRGRCEPCQLLPPESVLLIGDRCPAAKGDITGQAIQIAKRSQQEAQQAKQQLQQPPAPEPATSYSSQYPDLVKRGWTEDDFVTAKKLNDQKILENKDFHDYDPVVLARKK